MSPDSTAYFKSTTAPALSVALMGGTPLKILKCIFLVNAIYSDLAPQLGDSFPLYFAIIESFHSNIL